MPRSKLLPQSISCLGIGVCPRILLYIKKEKKMRGIAMVTTLSLHQQNAGVDIKQSLVRRSPEDHQVRTHAHLFSNNAQSCFVLPLSVLVRSSLNVCHETHS